MTQSEQDIRREQARKRLDARLEKTGPRQSRRECITHDNTAEVSPPSGGILRGLLETFGVKFIAIVALAMLLVLSFSAGMILRSCSDDTAAQASSGSPAPGTTTPTEGNAPATEETTVNKTAQLVAAHLEAAREEQEAEDLSYVLEDDLVTQMTALARVNDEVKWIAAHPTAYAIDGYAVQHKILKLAAEEPAASTFVRNWPDKYPSYDQDLKNTNAIETIKTGPHNIPLLFQWDPRWGYTVYSSTSFAMTGCCPTAFAMVYQGLTGKTDMTPYDMGVLAENDGYMSQYEGTDAYFIVNEAAGLGLNCWEVALDGTSVLAALENGQVLIANVGPGDFTTDGHFIVLTGIKDGKVIVNDPYSKVRSNTLWDADEIVWQSKVIFAYTAA